MALTPGTRFGPYEVAAQIGVGGMGEVYRAADTNLKRAVAIKVLAESTAGDAERLARFQREAEVLASLNHPNIAAIYGLERSAGTTALVMELVEGPTLADRIARGPIPIDDASAIARQIADALEAAHAGHHPSRSQARQHQGASGWHGEGAGFRARDVHAPERESPAAVSRSLSPTITSPAMMTGAGTLLGTAAYMSPEQAKGKRADRRSDLWAFGAVVYEMVTGRRAFAGDDVSDTLVSVLRDEPDWSALPPGTPPPIRRLLRRCLEKDCKRRFDSASDARLEIEDAMVAPQADSATLRPAPGPAWSRALPWAVIGTRNCGASRP